MRKSLTFIVAFICLMACASLASGLEEGKPELLPIVLNGKWGFIDRTGRVVVEPKFDALGDRGFSDELMDFRVGGKWGYVDGSGAIKIAAQFADVHPFSEGLAAVKVGSKWGFIDQRGVMAIAPQFADVAWGHAGKWSFSEGLAAIKAKGKWGFVNRAGEVVIRPQFDEVQVFFNGIARVLVKRTSGHPEMAGYINKAGEYVSQPTEDDYYGFHQPHAGDFSEGLSHVRDGLKWGFVNTAGEIVFEGFDSVQTFSEGLGAVKVCDKWGFIDKSGQIVVQPRFADVDSFKEGLAVATEADGTLGYIDKTGKMVVTIGKKQDSSAGSFFASRFKKGLAVIQLADESVYIDRTGAFVIKLERGDRGDAFSGERAQVRRGERISYIDKTGKYLFEPKTLLDPGGWSEGLMAARVEPHGPYGYIDQTGSFVIPPQYSQADKFAYGLAHVRVGDKHGLINRAGEFVLPLEFDDVSPFFDGIARVELGDHRRGNVRSSEREKIGYIDSTGKYIWKPTR
jgi:hypothetical protein